MSPKTAISLNNLKTELQRTANSDKIPGLQRYFKTGPGEYAEGDVFIGLTVPQQRTLAKKYRTLSLDEVEKLIQSKIHEERLTALLILELQFQKAKTKRKILIEFYLKNKKHINNWDLVDTSAEMLGEYLDEQNDFSILEKLLTSESVWDRRIAIIATFFLIKKKRPELTLQFAKVVLEDQNHLIQKSTGWMLREIGKRCGEKVLTNFLDQYVIQMPTIMFSYATERLTIAKKSYYQQIRRDHRKTLVISHLNEKLN